MIINRRTIIWDTSPRFVPLGHDPGSPASLPPDVNSPSCVNSGMSSSNAQASVSPVLSPMHYSVGNSFPPQDCSVFQKGSIFPSSSFLIAETDIAISPASESEDAHKKTAQTKNSMMNGDPMNAPIPLNPGKVRRGHSKPLINVILLLWLMAGRLN